MPAPIPVVPGTRYGHMTAIELAEPYTWPSGKPSRRVIARCDCGNRVTVFLNNLRSGNTTNCGCERDAKARERRLTHGMSEEPIYFCWCNMKQRSSAWYTKKGYAGVGRDPRWDDFEAFFADMGSTYFPGAVLARFGDRGDYTPTNCRWLTKSANSSERRPNR